MTVAVVPMLVASGLLGGAVGGAVDGAVGGGGGIGPLVAGALVLLAVLVLPARRAAREHGAGPAPDDDAPSRTGGDPPPRQGGRRTEPASGQVASALALLALGYRSGLPTWDVLEAVGDGLPAEPAADLRQVAAALRWGASDAEAWGSVGAAWSPAARAVQVAHLAGVPPAPLLLAAADDLREAELERIEVAAARVGVRLVAPLGLVLLPAFCLTTVVPLVIALARELVSS